MGGRVDGMDPFVFSSMTLTADRGRLIHVLVAPGAGAARQDAGHRSLAKERGRAMWT
jgi:hypothetical protein